MLTIPRTSQAENQLPQGCRPEALVRAETLRHKFIATFDFRARATKLSFEMPHLEWAGMVCDARNLRLKLNVVDDAC